MILALDLSNWFSPFSLTAKTEDAENDSPLQPISASFFCDVPRLLTFLASQPTQDFPSFESAALQFMKTTVSLRTGIEMTQMRTLPNSSFFRERRAPTLPSPAKIRAISQQFGHKVRFNRPLPVKIPSIGLFIKYGADVRSLRLRRRLCYGAIPW